MTYILVVSHLAYQSAKRYRFSYRSFTINNLPSTSALCAGIEIANTFFDIATTYITSNKAWTIYHSPVPLSAPTIALVFATPFVAMWQKTDTAIIELLSSLNSSAASSSATPSASLLPTPSGGATMSGGAIAGKVVGALIGSALIGALLIYLCIRWWRKRTGNGKSGAKNNWQKPELEGVGVCWIELPDKIDSQELQGPERPPVEMPVDVDNENDRLPTEEHQQEPDATTSGEVARYMF